MICITEEEGGAAVRGLRLVRILHLGVHPFTKDTLA